MSTNPWEEARNLNFLPDHWLMLHRAGTGWRRYPRLCLLNGSHLNVSGTHSHLFHSHSKAEYPEGSFDPKNYQTKASLDLDESYNALFEDPAVESLLHVGKMKKRARALKTGQPVAQTTRVRNENGEEVDVEVDMEKHFARQWTVLEEVPFSEDRYLEEEARTERKERKTPAAALGSAPNRHAGMVVLPRELQETIKDYIEGTSSSIPLLLRRLIGCRKPRI
jgi:hypothetical protein